MKPVLMAIGAAGCGLAGFVVAHHLVPAPAAAPVAGLRPGGETSVAFGPRPTFLVPAANLPLEARPDFHAGLALARQPWVKAPASTDARDGLGPLYNARSCLACHEEGGRGLAPEADGPLAVGTLVRLSRLGPHAGWRPDPVYGGQLQPRSIDVAYALGGVAPKLPGEGSPSVRWRTEPFEYPDGARAELRRPEVELGALGYGPLSSGTKAGLRHAPPLFGLGLLDRVPPSQILSRADPEDEDGDGISGRVARVWDRARRVWAPGRFGWKATQPNLRQQIASALAHDMGITSPLYPRTDCTPAQTACAGAADGAGEDGFEISDALLDLIEGFNRHIAVPERRKPYHPLVEAGAAHFAAFACASCHATELATPADAEDPVLAGQVIRPYTDLLLHDMGPGLAEPNGEGDAEGAEWRTPPLWGVGLARAVHEQAGLLHDGRARTVEEAVLWHGGEAAESRRRFVDAPVEQRRALIAFVRSL